MNILAQAKQALPVKDPDFSNVLNGFGKDVDNFGAPLDTSKRTILYVEGITVSFDGFRALNNLNLYVDEGELRCIIGPNGAGKTTMMDVITGRTKPDAGTVYFGQQINLLELSEHQIARGGIGRKFQKPTIFEALTVYENLELATASNKAVW
ncbi:MAG: ATP-binding cassette domain-containing protein, partial [Moraxellaceae bacterium]